MKSVPRRSRALVALLAVAVVALVTVASASAWSGGVSNVSGIHGANGWYTSNVTVTYTFHAAGVLSSSVYELLNQVTCTSNEGSTTQGDGTSGYTTLGGTLLLTQEGSSDTSCNGFGDEQHQISSSGCGSSGSSRATAGARSGSATA